MKYRSTLKDHLIEFKYPSIEVMTEEEMTNILSKGNTGFLVHWLSQLQNSVVGAGEKENVDIFSTAFCMESEIEEFMSFMSGEGEIDEDMKVRILYKLLRFLKDISEAKRLDESTTFSLEDLEDFVNADINLFPEYGPKQTLTEQRRAEKKQKYCEEIEALEQQLASIDMANNVKKQPDSSDLDKSIEAILDVLEANPLALNKLNLMPDKKGTEFVVSPEIIASCAQSVENFLEFINSVNVLSNFGDNFQGVALEENNSTSISELIQDVRKLAERLAKHIKH